MDKCFNYKGQKYGHENKIPISIKENETLFELPFQIYKSILFGTKAIICEGILCLFSLFFGSEIWFYILFWTIQACMLIRLAFIFISSFSVNCRFATKDLNEMKRHILKRKQEIKNYEDYITPIQENDGWYMIFEKQIKWSNLEPIVAIIFVLSIIYNICRVLFK